MNIKEKSRFASDSVKERALSLRRVMVDLRDAGNPIKITTETKAAVESLCMNLDFSAIEKIAQNEKQKAAIIHMINN